jgi:hypothetical protein
MNSRGFPRPADHALPVLRRLSDRGATRLFCRRETLGFGGELVALRLGEIGIEAGRIGRDEGIPGFLGADPFGELVVAANVGFRSRRRGNRRRHQRHVLAAERAGVIRLLLVGGRGQHVVAHQPQ